MLKIKKGGSKIFRFELRNPEGQFLLQSVPYTSENEAKESIEKLKKKGIKPLVFERKTDYNGKFLFNLKNLDGTLLGNSGQFESEAGMENGIKYVKKRITDL